MSGRTYYLVAGAIFGVVAIAHLLRIFMGLPVTIGGWAVPMWVSWVGALVAGALSYFGLRFSGRAGSAQS